jgi:PAS domain S-box-containing protein
MSLIARLYLLVLAAMLPALGIQLHHELELRRQGEERVRAEALRLARFAASEMDRIVESARMFLLALAHQPAVQTLDGPACSAYVAGFDGTPAFPFRGLVALDLAGRPFCAQTPLPPGAGDAERAYLKETLASGRLTVGQLDVARGGAWDLPVALPFDDLGGKRAGVVALGIGLEWLGDHFKIKQWPPGGSVTIADRAGTILVRWPNPEHVGSPMPDPFRWMLAATRPGTTEGTGRDGVARIAGYVPPADGNGLLVSVGLSKEAALAELDATLHRDLALIVVGLVLALLAANMGGRWFIRRPVDRLLKAAARWGRGDYAARVGLADRTSELGRLGQAFDAMAARLEDREAALRASEERFRLLADTVPDIIWTAAADGTITYANSRWFAYCGITPDENARNWPELVLHPEDRERCVAQWSRALEEGTPYEIEVRNRRHDGAYRWFLTRAVPVRDAGGRIVAWFGATTDIHHRKQAEQERELLLRELVHRIKNSFALVRSLATQSLRHTASLEEFGKAFLGRLDMLARLSTLLGADDQEAVDLRTVAEATLEPYRTAGNLRLEGPSLPLPARSARTLGLMLHELATNAAKYGALSGGGGTVDLSWAAVAAPEGPQLVLTWMEQGGPEVEPPARRGFGCLLIEESVTHGLGGKVRLEFPKEGVQCRIELPLEPGNDSSSR